MVLWNKLRTNKSSQDSYSLDKEFPYLSTEKPSFEMPEFQKDDEF